MVHRYTFLKTMLYLEAGNSTWKRAAKLEDGTFRIQRFAQEDPAHFVAAIEDDLASTDQSLLLAPVSQTGYERLPETFRTDKSLHLVDQSAFHSFIDGSYDQPEALGLDRILNLYGVGSEGEGGEGDREITVVVSCGTAITIDAIRADRPSWGAILPGYETARRGLHDRIPILPLASIEDAEQFPSRRPAESVANGIYRGTTHAVVGIARMLAEESGGGGVIGEKMFNLVVTGGEAGVFLGLLELIAPELMNYLYPAPDLLFRGMERYARDVGLI